MKATLHTLLCMTAVTVLPLLAGNGEPTSVPVEQRLLETDLSLAIRQYEHVQMEAFETRLKLDLLDTDEPMTDADRKRQAALLETRHLILQKRADELRAVTLKLALEITAAVGTGSRVVAVVDSTTRKKAKVLIKAQGITLPEFTLDGATFDQAVGELQAASRRYDTGLKDQKGVNYFVTPAAKTNASPKISLALKSVTLAEATERLAESAGLGVSAEDYAFVFRAKAEGRKGVSSDKRQQ